ncbi:MAG: hypothetical protein A2355_16230, partial [Spirochaetes bacterium RIFOXYB1_FULL_32_8]
SAMSVRFNTGGYQTLPNGAMSPDYLLTSGLNTLIIKVTAENQINIQYYTIHIFREQSYTALLSDIVLSEGILSPVFDENTFSYSVELPFTSNQIEVIAKAKIPGTHIETNNTDGSYNTTFIVSSGNLTIYITVISENGETNKYSLLVQKRLQEPAFSLAGGSFTSEQYVTLNHTMPDASIRYTLSGENPTINSPLYTAPVLVKKSSTLKAVAFHTEWLESLVSEQNYVIAGTVSPPEFSLTDGYISNEAYYVSISSPTPDVKIYYTTDNTEPNVNSTLYTIPLKIIALTTIKVVANHDNFGLSTVSIATFSVNTKKTVKFNSMTGSFVPDQIVENNTKLTEPVSEKAGYSLTGWYKENTYINKWVFSSDVVTDNITLYAKWGINNYNIIYNGNGNTSGNVPVTASYTYNTSVSVSANTGLLARTYYTFAGWNTKTDGTGVQYNVGTSYIIEDFDRTLYARWTTLPLYTLTFDSVGGSAIDAQTIISGEKASEPLHPIKTGYVFDGWYKENPPVTNWFFSTDTVTADTTLYAKWKPQNSLTITVEWRTEDTVELPGTITVPKGTDLSVVITEIFSSYTWYLDGNPIGTNSSSITQSTATLFAGVHELSVLVVNTSGIQTFKTMYFTVTN